MDDELAIVLRENGFGEITFSEHKWHLTTYLDGEAMEDFSFSFNDWFSPDTIRDLVERHVAMRFSVCDVTVEVMVM